MIYLKMPDGREYSVTISDFGDMEAFDDVGFNFQMSDYLNGIKADAGTWR